MVQPIRSVISGVLKQAQQHHGPLFEIQRRWKRIVGAELAAHTKPVSLRHGRLVIHVDRPGESFSLSFQKAQVLERARGVAPGKVTDLIVRAGSVQ